MIKFFRHIRKSLIAQNKMGKYFKYAIGEIILVMIGILLALQVNNWNEHRKALAKEQIVLKQLLSDAVADSIYFKDRLTGLDTTTNTLHFIRDFEENPNIDITKINTNGSGGIFLYGGIRYSSLLFDNNEDIYGQISTTAVKESLRAYRAKYGYIQTSYSLLNKHLRELSDNLAPRYYKELRQNEKDSSAAPLKKIYTDPYLRSEVDNLFSRINDAEQKTKDYLKANKQLSEVIKSHIQVQ